MNYRTINYKNSFISQVICRVDFLEMLSNDEVFEPSVISEITKNFTRKEMDQVIKFNFMNVNAPLNQSIPTVSGQTFDGIQLTYTSSDGKNKLILSNKFLIAEFNSYRTFEDFKNKIKNIISAIYRKRKITTERTGLRFINLFDSDKMKINKNMFVPSVASALIPIITSDIEELIPIRSMHLTEYRIENLNINFRFGLYNKAFPNRIASNDFVLDFDCFTNEGFQSSEDILRCVESGHDSIQYLFENSITDKLRAVMNHG